MTALPAYIDREAWEDYVAMRNRIKKPMSARRLRQLLARCYELKKAGHDVNQSLDEAADHQWLELYEPKDKTISIKATAEADRTQAYIAEHSRTRDPQAGERLREIKDKLRRVA
jgi:hypothetical protein